MRGGDRSDFGGDWVLGFVFLKCQEGQVEDDSGGEAEVGKAFLSFFSNRWYLSYLQFSMSKSLD